MDNYLYSPESKQVIIQFDRVSINIDLEDFLDMLYALHDLKSIIEEDPDVTIGTFEDENGKSWEQFMIKEDDADFS